MGASECFEFERWHCLSHQLVRDTASEGLRAKQLSSLLGPLERLEIAEQGREEGNDPYSGGVSREENQDTFGHVASLMD